MPNNETYTKCYDLISTKSINTKVVEYINKFDNSTDKGNLSEAKLKFVLQTMFQSG